MYSDSVLYAVSLFGWYIVLLLSVHVSVGVYCTDSGLCGLFSPPQKTANTVPLHTYQRMFFASAIAATDKYIVRTVFLQDKSAKKIVFMTHQVIARCLVTRMKNKSP